MGDIEIHDYVGGCARECRCSRFRLDVVTTHSVVELLKQRISTDHKNHILWTSIKRKTVESHKIGIISLKKNGPLCEFGMICSKRVVNIRGPEYKKMQI